MLGVIAGIIFLGVELRQNNELSRAEAERSRAAVVREGFGAVAENPELASILLRDAQGDPLTDLEKFQAQAFWMAALTSNELIYSQSIQSEISRTSERVRRFYATYPTFREVWKERAVEFDEAFVEWMDENFISERH